MGTSGSTYDHAYPLRPASGSFSLAVFLSNGHLLVSSIAVQPSISADDCRCQPELTVQDIAGGPAQAICDL